MTDWTLARETDAITDRRSTIGAVTMDGGTLPRLRRLWEPSEIELEVANPEGEDQGFNDEVWVRLATQEAVDLASTDASEKHRSASDCLHSDAGGRALAASPGSREPA